MSLSTAAAPTGLVVGVDIGGTFTDCVIAAPDGRITTGKASTTPHDRSEGFFDSIADAAAKMGSSLGEVMRSCERLVHGTTTGTNAILTRTGADVGLLATAGHGHAMFVMKGTGRTNGVSPDVLMDLVASRSKPAPIVPKARIVEVHERIVRDGSVLAPLTREEARRAAGTLLDQGVDAVAISLLWSIRNPSHEHLLVEQVRALAPEVFVTCSSDISGSVGEYPRTAATVMNAYIGPLMTRYVDAIERRARELGYGGAVLFSQCAGGAILADEARTAPILTLNSGPVAGVMGSVQYAQELGIADVLTTDMGGTTFDVSLIRGQRPTVTDLAQIEQYQLALPVVEVESIGAGGGSIAWIDASGRLNVGPRSAGAQPGPACYRRGGTEPTVTDADLVLGFLNPHGFLHGGFTLDVEAARQAVDTVGSRLGLSTDQAAAGIARVIDAKMADLLRRSSEFRGLDPRTLTMLAFGGAGPVHAAACAEAAGLREVIVPLPAVAPVWSAAGAANADVSAVFLESRLIRLPAPPEHIEAVFDRLAATARKGLEERGFGPEDVVLTRTLRMRYAAQIYDIEVPCQDVLATDEDVTALGLSFEAAYAQRFGALAGFADQGIQITGFLVRAEGRTPTASLLPPPAPPALPTETSRTVYWPQLGERIDTPVLQTDGNWGQLDTTLPGPVLVELPDTVVVVPPSFTARLRADGALVLTRKSS